MCHPGALAALGPMLGGGAAATAAGATAAAATGGIGATLATIGTVVSAGSQLMAGRAQAQAGTYQARLLEQQRETERALASVEAQRTSRRFDMQIAQQRAEIARRGVSLDSPTAVLLGETAAREASFAEQEVRSRGDAKAAELTGSARMARARGRQGMLSGGLSAASTILSAAPTLWPGLYDRGVGA